MTDEEKKAKQEQFQTLTKGLMMELGLEGLCVVGIAGSMSLICIQLPLSVKDRDEAISGLLIGMMKASTAMGETVFTDEGPHGPN